MATTSSSSSNGEAGGGQPPDRPDRSAFSQEYSRALGELIGEAAAMGQRRLTDMAWGRELMGWMMMVPDSRPPSDMPPALLTSANQQRVVPSDPVPPPIWSSPSSNGSSPPHIAKEEATNPTMFDDDHHQQPPSIDDDRSEDDDGLCALCAHLCRDFDQVLSKEPISVSNFDTCERRSDHARWHWEQVRFVDPEATEGKLIRACFPRVQWEDEEEEEEATKEATDGDEEEEKEDGDGQAATMEQKEGGEECFMAIPQQQPRKNPPPGPSMNRRKRKLPKKIKQRVMPNRSTKSIANDKSTLASKKVINGEKKKQQQNAGTKPSIGKSVPKPEGGVDRKNTRCRKCAGCKAKACGQCTRCKDNPKYGGPNRLKQACMRRRCQVLWVAKNERRRQQWALNAEEENRRRRELYRIHHGRKTKDKKTDKKKKYASVKTSKMDRGDEKKEVDSDEGVVE